MQFLDTHAPLYEQIAAHVENLILENKLEAGSRVQSVRDAALELGVNVNTVLRSYALLEERGILVKRRGTGYFPADMARQKILEKRREDFFKQVLPELAEILKKLSISPRELTEYLEKREKGD